MTVILELLTALLEYLNFLTDLYNLHASMKISLLPQNS